MVLISERQRQQTAQERKMIRSSKGCIGKWGVTVTWILIFLWGLGAKMVVGQEAQTLTVFAAASTTNAVTDIAKRFEESHDVKVRLSFASSSTLAKQIENGAPADIFLSANPKWMDYVSDKGAVVSSSRRDLLGNRIVLIAPEASLLRTLTVDSGLDLPHLLGDGRLAMGDPDHVPAGMYGKKALQTLGLWNAVKDKIAAAKDVRAALVLVERGETPLGQVYATDAAISKKVKVIGVFSEDSHPPIVYPVAMVKDTALAKEFIGFLNSRISTDIFQKYGFTTR
jgi:molybdate transport system substrate-binding protein